MNLKLTLTLAACVALLFAFAPAATAGPSPSVGDCYCGCQYDYWCYAAGCGGWQLCQDFTRNHCWWDDFGAGQPNETSAGDLESFFQSLEEPAVAPGLELPALQ